MRNAVDWSSDRVSVSAGGTYPKDLRAFRLRPPTTDHDTHDTPLSKDDVLGILTAVGDRAVLVGGQAVAWWAEFYGRQNRLTSLQRATDLYVSKDADFMPGSLEHEAVRRLVADVATRLRGTATSKFAFNSILVGSVEYRDTLGVVRSVEFLTFMESRIATVCLMRRFSSRARVYPPPTWLTQYS